MLAIWLASRAATTAIMLVFASRQPSTYWSGAHPGYFRYAQFWDSGWFHTIATAGYPLRLPVDAGGHVLPNAWAFLPVYPAVVRAVSMATTLPWDVASVVVAVACSLGAALVLDRLLQAVLGRRALLPVALFCVAPLSPVLQVGYAESTTLLLLAVALLLLVRRRYVALVPVTLLLDLTRPVGVPVAALLVVHVVRRVVRHRRERVRRREGVAAVALLAAGAIGAVAWPVIAWIVTGDRDAYVASELAWRSSTTGDAGLVPFVPWIQASLRVAPGASGPILLAVLCVGLGALLLLHPRARALGFDLRVWVAVYALYLLAVFDPQSSTWRLLMPLFPVLGAVTARSWWIRVPLLALGLVGQIVWFAAAWARWHVHGWSPP